jgi:hypothetical protein
MTTCCLQACGEAVTYGGECVAKETCSSVVAWKQRKKGRDQDHYGSFKSTPPVIVKPHLLKFPPPPSICLAGFKL